MEEPINVKAAMLISCLIPVAPGRAIIPLFREQVES
jgi:hypothetical protein